MASDSFTETRRRADDPAGTVPVPDDVTTGPRQHFGDARADAIAGSGDERAFSG